MKFSLTPILGIRIIALWSFVLALLAGATLLLLTQAQNIDAVFIQYWLIVGLNALFGLGFLAGGIGLWIPRQWGRFVFLITVCVWAGFNLLALLGPGIVFDTRREYGGLELALNCLRYIATLVVPFWYLNTSRVKAAFSKP